MKKEYERITSVKLKRFQITTLRSLVYCEIVRRKDRLGNLPASLKPAQMGLINELEELHTLLHEKETKMTCVV